MVPAWSASCCSCGRCNHGHLQRGGANGSVRHPGRDWRHANNFSAGGYDDALLLLRPRRASQAGGAQNLRCRAATSAAHPLENMFAGGLYVGSHHQRRHVPGRDAAHPPRAPETGQKPPRTPPHLPRHRHLLQHRQRSHRLRQPAERLHRLRLGRQSPSVLHR